MLKDLRQSGACSAQVALFKATFGESVTLTEELVREHGPKFDLNWVARHLFSDAGRAKYEAKRAAIYAEYEAKRDPIYAEWRAKLAALFWSVAEREKE